MMLFADVYRYVPGDAEANRLVRVLKYAATMLLHPGWHAVFGYRLARMFMALKLYPVSWLIYRWNMFVFSIDIHPRIRIGAGFWIPHPIGIVIARDASLGSECTVFQNVTIGGRGAPPSIGKGVMIGAGACIIGPVNVGDNVQIGANAVVVDSVPDNVSVGGVPAKVIASGK